MSRYLERLTREILGPSQALRPLTGSVFSRLPRQGQTEEAEPREESLFPRSDPSSGPELRPEHTPQPQPGSGRTQPPSPPPLIPVVPAVATAAPAQVGPQAPTREIIPVAPRSSSADPLRQTRLSQAPLQPTPRIAVAAQQPLSPKTSEPQPTPSMRPAPIRDSGPSSDPTAPQQAAPSPLLPLPPATRIELPIVATPQLHVGTTGSSHSVPPAARKVPQPSTTQPRAHEPDEIHIHIGRIEVTSVIPPPPRHTAPPTRKGPSLEDYLKRSSSRTQ